MKLETCMKIGRECGLTTIKECYYIISLHATSLFAYEDIAKELLELQNDILYYHPDIFAEIFDCTKRDMIKKLKKEKK